jgi:hypothetical protein
VDIPSPRKTVTIELAAGANVALAADAASRRVTISASGGGGGGGDVGQIGLSGPAGLLSSTLPAGTEGALELVQGIGLFRFSEASSALVDGETCVAPASGAGRWLLALPAADMALALFEGRDEAGDAHDGLKALIAATAAEAVPKSALIRASGSNAAAVTCAASATTAAMTVAAPGAEPGDAVALGLPAAWPQALAATALVTAGGAVEVRAANPTASAVTLPAGTVVNVTVIKKGDAE